MPELLASLRVLIDDPNLKQQYLILGSASRELIRQSSESLAGRIAYLELTPFSYSETGDLYPNKLKNWEFSKPNSQILSNLKDAREAEPCLKDRRDPRLEKQSGGLFLAGWLHGRPQGRDGAGIKSANLGEEKTDSSICLGITLNRLWI